MEGNSEENSAENGKGAFSAIPDRPFSETLGAVAEKIRKRFELSRLVLSEVDIASGQFNVILSTGEGGMLPSQGRHSLREFLPLSQIERLAVGEVVVAENARDLSDEWPVARIRASSTGSFITVPYVRAGGLRFALSGLRKIPSAWRRDDIELLSELSARVWNRLERAQAEAALRESEERFSRFMQHLPGLAWIKDADGRYVFANHAAETVFGTPIERLYGKTDQEIFPPAVAEQFIKNDRQALEEGKGVQSVETLRHEDGILHHSLVSKFPIPGPAGDALLVGGVAIDITEQKEAEEQRAQLFAREQEARREAETLNELARTLAGELDLETLVQRVTDVAVELSNAEFGAFFYNVLNDAGESFMLYTLSGAPREAFEKFGMPRNTPVFAPTFHGEGIVRVDDITKDPRYGTMAPHHGMPKGHLPVRSYLALPVISRSGSVIGGLFFGHSKPGVFTERDERLVAGLAAHAAIAMDNAQLYREAQEEIGHRRAAQAALQRSEGRLRAMFESTTVGVAVLATDGKFIEINDAFCTIAGRTREEMLALDFAAITHPSDVAAMQERVATLREGRSDSYVSDKRYVRPDGSIVWVQNNVSAIRDAEGRAASLVAMTQDVTARHIAEIEIRRANERFRIAEQASRGFVYDWEIATDRVKRSQGFAIVLGYAEGEIPESGSAWRELIHPDDLKIKDAETEDAVRRGDARVSAEYRVRHKNGTWVWVLDECAVISDEEGMAFRLVGSTVDINARKRAENRLTLAAGISELTRSITSPSDLLYEVSRAVGEHLDVRRCLFNEIDIGRDLETVHRDYCRGVESVAGEHRISKYSPVTSAEMIAGRTVVNRDSAVDPRTADFYSEVYSSSGERAYVAVPLLREGEWVASLWVSDDVPRDWDAQEISLLETVAERTWTAIEKLRAASALLESEERFSKAFKASPLVLTISSLETGKLIEVNDTFIETSGFTREEAIGKTTVELGVWKNVTDREAEMEMIRHAGELNNAEFTFLTKHGDEIIGLLSAERIEIGGRPYALTVIQDITERKRAQEALLKAERRAAEEYQALLQLIVPLGETLGTARELKTVYRSILEFVRSSMPCSAFFVSFFDAETRLRTAAFAWGEGGELDTSKLPPIELTENGGPNSRAVYEREPAVVNRYMDVMRKHPHVVIEDNGVDPMSSLAVPMIVADRVLGTIEVQAYHENAFTPEHVIALEMVANLAAVAIENVRLLEIEARARAEAEAANQMKDEFLSILSHELRTPLNAMLGWIRMLRARILDEERTEKAFEVIERNTRQQSSLIEDLLDVSRIISGKMRIEKQLVDLAAVVHDAAETMRPLAASGNVRFSADEAPEPIFIEGDTVRLRQVFTNLLQNAIKFTPAGGTVTIEIGGGDSAVVTVRDSGVGIEPEFLPHIFDRFSQADASTRRAFAGLGLGLTIVKTIVDLHGGNITVDSEGADRGAAFTVRLPFARTILRGSLHAADETSNPHSQLAGIRILVVDDDAESLIPLQTFLSHEGAIVTAAASADESLEFLESGNFDLLISDIGMPGKDGYEMVRALRASTFGNKSIPAIALTAYASNDDRDRALDAGYQSHLPKPLDFDDLFREIKVLQSGGPENLQT